MAYSMSSVVWVFNLSFLTETCIKIQCLRTYLTYNVMVISQVKCAFSFFFLSETSNWCVFLDRGPAAMFDRSLHHVIALLGSRLHPGHLYLYVSQLPLPSKHSSKFTCSGKSSKLQPYLFPLLHMGCKYLWWVTLLLKLRIPFFLWHMLHTW